jgi:hypothetical protein
MRTAKLEILDITVPLRWNQYYHDEGYVSSIISGVKRVSEQYKDGSYVTDLYSAQLLDLKLPRGKLLVFQKGFWFMGQEHLHILYEKQKIPLLNFNIRAHEECHAVEKMPKGLFRLEELMKATGFTMDFPLTKTSGEITADIAEIYALYMRGFSRAEILDTLPKFHTKQMKYLHFSKK